MPQLGVRAGVLLPMAYLQLREDRRCLPAPRTFPNHPLFAEAICIQAGERVRPVKVALRFWQFRQRAIALDHPSAVRVTDRILARPFASKPDQMVLLRAKHLSLSMLDLFALLLY